MPKRAGAVILTLVSIGPLAALQKPKSDPVKKYVLTDEEKEILRNREILENLDLLRNFEKFHFMDFFRAESGSPAKNKSEETATKQDGKQEK